MNHPNNKNQEKDSSNYLHGYLYCISNLDKRLWFLSYRFNLEDSRIFFGDNQAFLVVCIYTEVFETCDQQIINRPAKIFAARTDYRITNPNNVPCGRIIRWIVRKDLHHQRLHPGQREQAHLGAVRALGADLQNGFV